MKHRSPNKPSSEYTLSASPTEGPKEWDEEGPLIKKKTTLASDDDDDDGVLDFRHVDMNDRESNATRGYCCNTIITSRYTVYSFLPKILFYEFSKLANAYFLIISLMQTNKVISNTGGFPASLPALCIIVTIDMIFAALEDWKRHESDHVSNHKQVLRVNPIPTTLEKDQESLIGWNEIHVGDILKIQNREGIPADVVILATSSPSGICYVETKSLDGETNLKLRQGLECTTKVIQSPRDVLALRGRVICETPNHNIHRFGGSIRLENGTGTNASENTEEPIGLSAMLLRGSTLRNTDYVYAFVINTGPDTKIMRSSRSNTPAKWSNIEKKLNRQILYIVALMFTLCFVGAGASTLWSAGTLSSRKSDRDAYYLYDPEALDTTNVVAHFFVTFVYYFLLLNSFIPVSLYVSMTSVKFAQSIFMNADVEMYHAESNTPAQVRSMALNEELGQIDYIFSDKTGTLTCNVMDFRKCSIAGVSYGKGTTEIGLAAARRYRGEAGLLEEIPEAIEENDEADSTSDESCVVTAPFVNFEDPVLVPLLNRKCQHQSWSLAEQQTLERVEAFWEHLAICHTVMPEPMENGEIRLSASSPDEQALVAAAGAFGFRFCNRSPGVAHIQYPKEDSKEEGDANDDDENPILAYEILDVLEFNSTRKRMSIVTKTFDGRFLLLSKGADSVMYERLEATTDIRRLHIREQTLDQLEVFANEGLRTLVIASAELDRAVYDEWQVRYHAALNDLAQVEKRQQGEPNDIDVCMDELEVNLEILGATAIEDRLQQGVPETISKLALAGINLWMLTGDKEETAINIGFACELLTMDMERMVVSGDGIKTSSDIQQELQNWLERMMMENEKEVVEPMKFKIQTTEVPREKRMRTPDHSIAMMMHEEEEVVVLKTLHSQGSLGEIAGEGRIKEDKSSEQNLVYALVIDGEALELALDECPELLFQITQKCKAVIACRVSPAQKSQLVELVRSNCPSIRTLAIGDGANDVSMIQAAHVGIGISGQEGLQAVNSSDYAIAQFRFLQRLLLVHGRWNYIRMSKLILYIFYKNVMMNLVQYWYMYWTGFSGQKFFLEYGLQAYNLALTAVPVILVGIFEQDLPDHVVMAYPMLYQIGQRDTKFNTKTVWTWISSCGWESLIIALGTIFGLDLLENHGSTPTTWVYGCTAFTITVLVVNLKLALHQDLWLWFHPFVYFLSVMIWWIGALVISEELEFLSPYWNGVFTEMLENPNFWFLWPFLVFLALSRDFFWKGYKRNFTPSFRHLVQEVYCLPGWAPFAHQLLSWPIPSVLPTELWRVNAKRGKAASSPSSLSNNPEPSPSVAYDAEAAATVENYSKNDETTIGLPVGSRFLRTMNNSAKALLKFPYGSSSRAGPSPGSRTSVSRTSETNNQHNQHRGFSFSYDAESIMAQSMMVTERFQGSPRLNRSYTRQTSQELPQPTMRHSTSLPTQKKLE